jgi:predicted GNAT family acetyltransferase
MKVVRHNTAEAFLERTTPWLVQAEAENHIVFGIADVLRNNLHRYGPELPFLLSVEAGGSVVGAALRTPPHKLLLARMPAPALEALAEFLLEEGPDLPAVTGPAEVAEAFSGIWAGKTGKVAKPGMSVRAHLCDRVIHPEYSPGRMRVMEAGDVDLALAWTQAFVHDAHVTERSTSTRESMRAELATGSYRFWEDGSPVSMARYTGETPNGVRIGLVYTPPENRRKGYATSCVAALTQCLLDSGRKTIFLYTDMANPTSNKIYRAVGFRPVMDGRDFLFL